MISTTPGTSTYNSRASVDLLDAGENDDVNEHAPAPGYASASPLEARTEAYAHKNFLWSERSPLAKSMAQLLEESKGTDNKYDTEKVAAVVRSRLPLLTREADANDYRTIADQLQKEGMTDLAKTIKQGVNQYFTRRENAARYAAVDRSEFAEAYRHLDKKGLAKQYDLLNKLQTKNALVYLAKREQEIETKSELRDYRSLNTIADELYDALKYIERTGADMDKKVKARLESLAEQARHAQLHPRKKKTGLMSTVTGLFKRLF